MVLGNFTPSFNSESSINIRWVALITSYAPPQDLAADRVRHGAAKLKPVGL